MQTNLCASLTNVTAAKQRYNLVFASCGDQCKEQTATYPLWIVSPEKWGENVNLFNQSHALAVAMATTYRMYDFLPK